MLGCASCVRLSVLRGDCCRRGASAVRSFDFIGIYFRGRFHLFYVYSTCVLCYALAFAEEKAFFILTFEHPTAVTVIFPGGMDL